MACQGRN